MTDQLRDTIHALQQKAVYECVRPDRLQVCDEGFMEGHPYLIWETLV
jgi:hypothetical protein